MQTSNIIIYISWTQSGVVIAPKHTLWYIARLFVVGEDAFGAEFDDLAGTHFEHVLHFWGIEKKGVLNIINVGARGNQTIAQKSLQ